MRSNPRAAKANAEARPIPAVAPVITQSRLLVELLTRLAQDELERASRFVFARDLARFIATASASRTPGRPEPFLSDDGDRWTIRSFEPEVGYAGAVVVEGEDLPCFWEFNHW